MSLFAIAYLGGLTVALLAYVVLSPDTAGRRLQVVGGGDAAASGWRRFLVEGVAPRVEPIVPSTYFGFLRRMMRRAGRPGAEEAAAALGAQGLVALFATLIGLVALGPAGAFAGAVFGIGVPLGALAAYGTRRQVAIDRAIPDALDLLTASVEAGLALDAAVVMTSTRMAPAARPLGEELARYLQEVRMGVARAQALRNLAERNESEDLRHLVAAINQGEMLGVGVARVLRAQAAHVRARRRQRAEERAMKAPIKILFPLVFGIFPAVFVVVLGPAVLRLLDALGTGN